MDRSYKFIPKKTFILVLFLSGGILILGSLVFLKPSQNTTQPISNPIISQIPLKITPLQKSVIGKTTKAELGQSYPNTQEENLPNGNTSYQFNSSLADRSHEVQFHNNISIFERVILLGDNSNSLTVQDLILKYGQAEKTTTGSIYYGRQINTYIYPSKGLAFIANPNIGEVFELQTFSPTSLEEYMNNFGQDIKEFGQILE